MGDVRVSDQVAEIAQTAIVRPGDTLIVRVDPRGTSRDLLDRLIRELEERLPAVKVVVIGAEELAVYRSAPAEYKITVDAGVTPYQADRFLTEMSKAASRIGRQR